MRSLTLMSTVIGIWLWHTFRADEIQRACGSLAAPNLDIVLARVGLLPVNQPGLATRWATQRVDGGSAGVVADRRRARSRARTALRPGGASVRVPVRAGRILFGVWRLV